MFAALWTKIRLLFSTNKIGIIFKLLITNAASAVVKSLTDKTNQQKAYEFVKSLNARKDLSTADKAKEFNKKMAEWAKTFAKKELSTSVINCLREIAVAALKAENNC